MNCREPRLTQKFYVRLGGKSEFTSLPQQANYKTKKYSEQENRAIAQETQQLLVKQVIVKSIYMNKMNSSLQYSLSPNQTAHTG